MSRIQYWKTLFAKVSDSHVEIEVRSKYSIQEYTSGTWTPRLKIIWHDTTKNIIFIDDSSSQNKIWKGTLRQEIHDTSSAGC